jgi:hypothetical protein
MTKRPYKRRLNPRTTPTSRIIPYVVYVTFPSGGKEYVYLCTLPHINVGSKVIANGTVVTVHRVAGFDSLATRYVQSAAEHEKSQRKKMLLDRLVTIERETMALERWKALARKSPEARKLLKELESLA